MQVTPGASFSNLDFAIPDRDVMPFGFIWFKFAVPFVVPSVYLKHTPFLTLAFDVAVREGRATFAWAVRQDEDVDLFSVRAEATISGMTAAWQANETIASIPYYSEAGYLGALWLVDGQRYIRYFCIVCKFPN